MTKKLLLVLVIAGLLATAPVLAQQTGSVSGRVISPEGEPLPGVTVEARSEVLPQARVTTSGAGGGYRLPLLPPGRYTLTFSLAGMESVTRELTVLLQQDSVLNVTMAAVGFEEEIQVLSEASLIDPGSAELKQGISNEEFARLPVAQQYRDILKLVPGVQYSEDAVRGPSAGGHGQDNVYQFDGVDVSMPLFGVLSSEPSSHDIDQVATVRGGAKATEFNRSGGFTINTVSKSGTNRYHGELGYQLQSEDTTSDFDPDAPPATPVEVADEERDWAVANVGGPVLADRLFFYTSYYRPTRDRLNRANVYGAVPEFESVRDEFFGKLTFTPTNSVLVHASYRDSDREEDSLSVGTLAAASTSEGSDATLEIGILEGSWVVNNRSFFSARYLDFANENFGGPDRLLGFSPAIDGSLGLDVNNLDRMGLFLVPLPEPGENRYNARIAPLIERFGYVEGGVKNGGGEVGAASTINDQDFFREAYEASYDYALGEAVSHELHIGYQWARNEEELDRTSNGWGVVSVPIGDMCLDLGDINGDDEFLIDCSEANTPQVLYQARFQQMSLGLVPSIDSAYESQSIELNDTIRWGNWSFNAGVLLSNDTYLGQGLRPNSNNVSGFELAIGHEYEMLDVDFDEMIQPRLGAVWAYNGHDTLYANYARYHPAATSLPRAASWDRNLAAEMLAYFDEEGTFLGATQLSGSSGKFFDDDLDPRGIDEYMIGTSRQITNRWSARASARYRDGFNFWEDTNNDARSRFEPPPGVPTEDYIPNLDEVTAEIGGSSYVIAELDGAFTKYYEAALETDWRGDKTYVRGSLVWSHYYGNFDQDNSTTENDDAIFIGSSFLADGAGRQVWDNKYGDLRGDRRYMLKVFGSYQLDWNASVGAFAVYQDGQPWEIWDYHAYSHLTSSTSSTSRNAEAAGSRRTDDHYQLDLNYTQNFQLGDRFNVQLAADIFNAFDKQTGYNIQNKLPEAGFGAPRSFYDPRRLQLAARFRF